MWLNVCELQRAGFAVRGVRQVLRRGGGPNCVLHRGLRPGPRRGRGGRARGGGLGRSRRGVVAVAE